jgi:putative hydrolase of the HAD superfamily
MITTIIFDWAGVLTTGRYTQSILETLSNERDITTEEIYGPFDVLIGLMDSDLLTFTDFTQKVNTDFKLDITEDELREVFARAIHPNNEVIQMVKELQPRYNLILLSNGSKINVTNLHRDHKDMLALFSKTYFSCELKLSKPDSKIFEHVIEDTKLKPEECVFIDDKQENVDAAKQCGMHGIVYTNFDQVKRKFDSLGIHQ